MFFQKYCIQNANNKSYVRECHINSGYEILSWTLGLSAGKARSFSERKRLSRVCEWPHSLPIGAKDTPPGTSSRVSFMESAVILYYFNLFVVFIDSIDIMVDGVINDKVGVFILRIMIVVRFLYLMSICVHQFTANYLS